MNKFHSNRYKKCNRKVRQTKKLNFPRRSNLKSLKQIKLRSKLNQSIPKMSRNPLNLTINKIRNKCLNHRNTKIKMGHLNMKINLKLIKARLTLSNKVMTTQVKLKSIKRIRNCKNL